MQSHFKKTLLIGGNGFIGAELAQALHATQRSISVVSRSPNRNPLLDDSITYHQGNFGDLAFISPLIAEHDEIVHLAYASVPNTSFENPLTDLQENLTPSVQLFLETAKLGKRLLLVSSGGTVYGEACYIPISEVHPKHPISPYGLTKLTLENYANLYSVTHGLEYMVVRPGNAYGIGQTPFKGQGFVATAIASARLGKPIKIFGLNGSVRDYIYITDLANAIVSTLTSGRPSESYNIGTGVGYNNLELINHINTLLQVKNYAPLKVEHLPSRPFDVKCNVLDYAKLNHHTGWQPLVSLEQGLSMTIDSMFL